MDALVKAAELRGHKVVVEGHDNKVVTVIEAHGEEIAIKLTEKTTQHKTVPAPDESRAKHPWESARRYSFAPSGRLTLEIDEYSRERITKRWQDGPRCQLEDCLNEFFVSVLRFAAVKRNERATRERERLDEERRRQQREQRQRLIAEEQKRLDGLLQDVEAWHLARRIRTYLKAIDESSDEVTDDWIRWAADQADRIDPSVPSPKSILDEVEPPRETSDLLSLLMDGLGWEETPPKNFWARRPWRTR
jgi:hypothetical protein